MVALVKIGFLVLKAASKPVAKGLGERCRNPLRFSQTRSLLAQLQINSRTD